MIPGLDDAKTTEMSARLDDRIGVAAVTYLLFFVKLGPGLALFLVLVFAIWIGWRWLCRKCPSGPFFTETAPLPPILCALSLRRSEQRRTIPKLFGIETVLTFHPVLPMRTAVVASVGARLRFLLWPACRLRPLAPAWPKRLRSARP